MCADLLFVLLEKGITIVVAPITHNQEGQLLNTNADTIAQEIAKGMSTLYDVMLIYSFEKNGVLADINDGTTIIPEITPSYYKKLKDKKIINEGMLPKLDNAFTALNNGVKKVVIGNAEMLAALISGKNGTTIINE